MPVNVINSSNKLMTIKYEFDHISTRFRAMPTLSSEEKKTKIEVMESAWIPHASPNYFLSVLKDSPEEETSDGKKVSIPKSYGSYLELQLGQKYKVCEYWSCLSQEKITAVSLRANEREKITADSEELERRSRTTPHEMFRLILLMTFADASVYWTQALSPYDNRFIMDAANSGDDFVRESIDPYTKLAEIYNSPPEVFPVLNMACKYVDGIKQSTIADPVFAYENSGNQLLPFTVIFERVKDLDPSIYKARDKAWIEEKSKSIRSTLTSICGSQNSATGFWRSGFQDGQNVLSAWSNYCSNKGQPNWLDACILTNSFTDFFGGQGNDGKSMNEDGKDTGLLGEDNLMARQRRREKDRIRQRKRRHRDVHSSGASTSSDFDNGDNDFDNGDDKWREHSERVAGIIKNAFTSDSATSNAINAASALLKSDKPELVSSAERYLFSLLPQTPVQEQHHNLPESGNIES